MTVHLATAFTGVLTLLVLSACGSADQLGRTTTPMKPTAPTMTKTSPMPTASPGLPEALTVPPTGSGRKNTSIRVRGTVSNGVEPGCRLLTANGVVYLLIWQGNLVSGREVEVQGKVQPDLMTTCQQGKPLVVERVVNP